MLTDEGGFAPVIVMEDEADVLLVIDGDFRRDTFLLDQPDGEYRLPRYLPLRITIVDGVTGRVL